MLLKLVSPGDAAKRLNLSASRVIQLDRAGVLPAMRDSAGRRFFDAEDVERFARERESARDASSDSVRAGRSEAHV
jgi:DNA-binding transcriptional MerR regulator